MDKKYWFKLDKDKIKLQLKSLGKKFTKKETNFRMLVLVILFFILVGAGYAVYRNDTTNINPGDNTGPTVSQGEATVEEQPIININPYEESSAYSLDYQGIDEDESTGVDNNNRLQEPEGKETGELPATSKEEVPEEEAVGVVTEGIRTLDTTRNQSFSLLKPVSGEVLQEPGWYYHPVLDDWRYQHGIELSGNPGDVVMAAEGGRVVSVTEDEYKGIIVTIEHENGWKTQYGHLQKASVNRGEVVARGQEIGRVGTTGMSSTPSLYFVLSNQDGPIDPREYFSR